MDRQIVYPGQIPLETDLLNTNKYAMIALAKMAAAMLGTATLVSGLGCVPTGPASLQVVVNPGEIYSLANIDATAYWSVLADTAHSILKQGFSLDTTTLWCPAPATAGQSVNYLIQAAYQDSDTGLITLPYYNASNPTQAWSGPGGSGAQQATARKGIVSIQVKAGVAATTGTQTTPAPDAGYSGLWVVTVANGQTTITSASIAQAPNAPILPTDLLHAIQQNALTTAVDAGSANAYAVSYSPPITALTDGMVLWFKAKTANNGASTLNVNGLGAQPLVGGAHAALQGGEIVANGKCQAVWRADISSFVLLECTGGALQVAPGTASGHAANLGQLPPLLRNYIAGLVLSNDATNPNTQIDIAPGVAVDGANAYEMVLSTILVKTLQSSGAWASGTGNNGLFSGARANSTWYHVFLIRNASTGAVDAGFDTSVTAANAPGGWTANRRIGSILTDTSGNIRAFLQANDEFLWVTPTLDINVTGAGPGTTAYAVTVPPGVVVDAIIHGKGYSTSSAVNIGLQAVGANDAPALVAPVIATTGANVAGTVGRAIVRTNTSQQILLNASASSTAYSMSAYGWRDYRGRNV